MVRKKRTHKWGAWKSGWVEQADRRLEKQSTGLLCSHKGLASVDLASLLTLEVGGEGRLEGAVNKHRPSPKPSPRTFQSVAPQNWVGMRVRSRMGAQPTLLAKLNFHVAAFKRLPAWQIKSSYVKGHSYVLETEIPTDPSVFLFSDWRPFTLHSGHDAAVRASLLTCKYSPVTWPFGIVQGSH